MFEVRETGRFGSETRRRRWLKVLVTLAVFVYLGQAPAQPPPDAKTEELRRAFWQVVPASRQHRNVLKQAERRLRDGATAEAFSMLQAILDQPQDAFLFDADLARPISARNEAARILAASSADSLESYQALYGDLALRDFQEAAQAGDAGRVAGVLRRYGLTTAGRSAADWLAREAMDRGDAAAAARLWDQLQPTVNPGRFTTLQRLTMARAYRQSGQPEVADALLAGLLPRDKPPAWASDWGSVLPAGRLESPREYLNYLGTPERRGVAAESQPLWRVAWSAALFDDAPELAEQVDDWALKQFQAGQPVVAAVSPVVVGDRVIVRDPWGLRAVRLADGAPLWKYACATPMAKMGPVFTPAPTYRRPRSLPALAQVHALNGVQGILSSDGRCVFTIDGIDTSGAPAVRDAAEVSQTTLLPDGTRLERDTNRLLAIDVETGRLRWSAGGRSGRGRPDTPLSSHYFLGAPLAIGQSLFALTESNRQLSVVCLAAETGQLAWLQTIALTPQGVDAEAGEFLRRFSGSLLAEAGGRLICPTECGVLACLDSATGNLLWLASTQEIEIERRLGPSRPWTPVSRIAAGFCNLPLIAGGRVLYLHRDSSGVQSFDLATGARQWAVSRGDGQYLAGTWGDVLVVAGERGCRGLHLDDGRELWTANFSITSGRAMRTADRFWFPCADGRLIEIDPANGQALTTLRPRTEIAPGHLVPAGDMILSITATQIDALPQSAPLLRSLLAKGPAADRDDDQTLLLAELRWRLGENDEAAALLEPIANRPGPVRTAARDLLRDVSYDSLASANAPQDQLLETLARLADTPADRQVARLHAAQQASSAGEDDRFLTLLSEIVAEGVHDLPPVRREEDRFVSATEWLRQMVHDAGGRERRPLLQLAEREARRALELADAAPLESYLAAFGELPPAELVRNALARRLMAEKSWQAAEILLLRNRTAAPPQAAEALRLLAELSEQAGAPHAAGRYLAELETNYADQPLADGVTGAEYLVAYPRHLPGWQASRGLRPVAWPVERVRIRAELDPDPQLTKTFSNFAQRLTPNSNADFELLDRGAVGLEENRQQANIYDQTDRDTGHVLNSFQLPQAISPSPFQRLGDAGQLLPVATRNGLVGVSLLEREPAWETVPWGQTKRPESARVGPHGADYCIVQTTNSLLNLDPATGAILWQRRDLDPQQGLFRDQSTGLFGDAEAITIFALDRLNYRVFDTRTGRLVRTGRLDLNPSLTRLAYGRALLYVTAPANVPATPQGGPDSRLRLWDPLHDRTLFEAPYTPAVRYVPVFGRPEFQVTNVSGEIQVIDGATGAERLKLQLPQSAVSGINFVRCLADADNYYLNLQPASSGLPRRGVTLAVTDALMPGVHLFGELYAIRRATGEVLWRQTIPQQTVLQMPDAPLPFLVMLSRVQERTSTETLQFLRVQAYDSATGDLVGLGDRIFNDRLLLLRHNPAAAALELRGAYVRIHLDYRPALRLPDADGVVARD